MINTLGRDRVDELFYMLEAKSAIAETKFVTETIYPSIEKVLSTPEGDRKFRTIVKQFIERNSDKLHTSGPVHMIAYMDSDKKQLYTLFNISEREILDAINKFTKIANANANWKLVKQNPIFCVIFECIRYYTIKKDEKGVNTALAIYALAAYPSAFHKYFMYGANPDIMAYTIDNLTSRFLFKQQGNLLATLMASIQNSYNFLKNDIKSGTDEQVSRFISRIRNDHNSLLKNISNEYYKNYQKNNRIRTSAETYADNEAIDDQLNDTSMVEDTCRKISHQMIINGVDLTRATAAARLGNVSISDLRFYMSKIITKEKTNELNAFIESILFIFLYQENHKAYEINEMLFLSFGGDLFRRTNSGDKNVVTIKTLLTKWTTETGIIAKYNRPATQINYKRAIFMYFILCIQYYNQ